MERRANNHSLFTEDADVLNDVLSLYNDSNSTAEVEIIVSTHLNVSDMSNGSTVLLDDDTANNSSGVHQIVTIIAAIVGFVLLVGMCLCMKSTHTPEAERRIRRYRRGGWKRRPPNYYRLKRIKKSLTVQQVVKVDKSGEVQLSDVRTASDANADNDDDDDVISDASSAAQHEDANVSESDTGATNYENLVACCCICLEPYEVGDIVAWSNSATEDCLHVFHHDCIHLWLINPKHKDCPSCRTIILQKNTPTNADDASNNTSDEDFDENDDDNDLERQRRRRDSNNNRNNSDDAQGRTLNSNNNNNANPTSVAYYIMHGLISRASQVKFTLIGQTISFDSEDSDYDGLYQTRDNRDAIGANGSTLAHLGSSDWMNQPSTFRRAMSFSDRIFSNTFTSSTATTAAMRRQQQIGGMEWKPVASTDGDGKNDIDTDTASFMRRASTKVILDLKSLQQAPALRRVVSAGPCTPLDMKKHSRKEQSGRFSPSDFVDQLESNTCTVVTPERLLTVPFRRSSSLRHRGVFNPELLSDCDENDEQRIMMESNTDIEVPHVDNTDSTEEDVIIIQKEL